MSAETIDATRWPTYRPRRGVVARRLAEPTWLDGRFFREGYMVRDENGRILVVGVADFEAVYELAGLNG